MCVCVYVKVKIKLTYVQKNSHFSSLLRKTAKILDHKRKKGVNVSIRFATLHFMFSVQFQNKQIDQQDCKTVLIFHVCKHANCKGIKLYFVRLLKNCRYRSL